VLHEIRSPLAILKESVSQVVEGIFEEDLPKVFSKFEQFGDKKEYQEK